MNWEVGGGELGSWRGNHATINRTFAGRNQERNQVGNQMTEEEDEEAEHTHLLRSYILARPKVGQKCR